MNQREAEGEAMNRRETLAGMAITASLASAAMAAATPTPAKNVSVKGAVALVTGSNRGVGRGFVEVLLARGAKRVYATGRNPKGCTNPSVDGIFDPALVGTLRCLPAGSSHCWLSAPCPAGTCNLVGASKAWCDAVNDGQCADSRSRWAEAQRGSGGPDSCGKNNQFTTYCYSHNDATSSPYLAAPYKMKLTYRDLA